MAKPLLLTRRAPAPTQGPRALPPYRYNPHAQVNVVADGTALVHVADPAALADYTGTQEAGGWKTDD
ncbi:hypothetical protein [Embleya scabrispora]|uniref:hypothetical protein n=1 Tax=Embleya scabrispora TaxID=159449 RepID=UPI00036878C4|nr:hypothetical protein [Embleya scabrispora]MYS78659.1 hypothetical protein [Streptomyces sp. SID5474]